MSELQQFFSQWITGIADLLPLGYAFGAGMVSTVNPCGFAMLPAYLGLYVGRRDFLAVSPTGHTGASGGSVAYEVPIQLMRALVVAAAVTLGFVVFFGGVGLAVSAGGRLIIELAPWIALGIGAALVWLGVAMLFGRHISASFAARLADRLGDPRRVTVKGFFVFGIAFAAASLSCTLPIFLTVVGTSLATGGLAGAALQFVSYALGMGLVVMVLTISIGLFKGALVGGLRSTLPHVERVSGFLLIGAGSYVVYYWLFKGGLIDTFG